MKYKILILFFLLYSCASLSPTNKNQKLFSSKGFAYIYSEDDYLNKIIKKKFNNNEFFASHPSIKVGKLIKITNPENNLSIILKNSRKIKELDFYKILITKPVSNELALNKEIPFVEIQEIKKNKLFVAQKAKMFKEERSIHNKAPVEKITINNISKNIQKKTIKSKKFNIIIAQFYSIETAKTLQSKLRRELSLLNVNNIKVIAINKNNIQLLSGPYDSINLLRKDYSQIKKYGFEDLDIKINE